MQERENICKEQAGCSCIMHPATTRKVASSLPMCSKRAHEPYKPAASYSTLACKLVDKQLQFLAVPGQMHADLNTPLLQRPWRLHS